jgi:hypothetical protein
MSSTLLYLAIVAVWAGVLVPMWLRREGDAPAFSRLLHRRAHPDDVSADDASSEDASADDGPSDHASVDDASADGAAGDGTGPGSTSYSASYPYSGSYDEETLSEGRPLRHPNGRAAVIARRRRRTSGLVLLVLVLAGVSLVGLAPWWAVLPPVGLLAGHVSLLRVAAGMDAARSREAAVARLEARALERERRMAEAASEAEEADRAEVIDLTARNRAGEVFDQYTDQLRAVGD